MNTHQLLKWTLVSSFAIWLSSAAFIVLGSCVFGALKRPWMNGRFQVNEFLNLVSWSRCYHRLYARLITYFWTRKQYLCRTLTIIFLHCPCDFQVLRNVINHVKASSWSFSSSCAIATSHISFNGSIYSPAFSCPLLSRDRLPCRSYFPSGCPRPLQA